MCIMRNIKCIVMHFIQIIHIDMICTDTVLHAGTCIVCMIIIMSIV